MVVQGSGSGPAQEWCFRQGDCPGSQARAALPRGAPVGGPAPWGSRGWLCPVGLPWVAEVWCQLGSQEEEGPGQILFLAFPSLFVRQDHSMTIMGAKL